MLVEVKQFCGTNCVLFHVHVGGSRIWAISVVFGHLNLSVNVLYYNVDRIKETYCCPNSLILASLQ